MGAASLFAQTSPKKNENSIVSTLKMRLRYPLGGLSYVCSGRLTDQKLFLPDIRDSHSEL